MEPKKKFILPRKRSAASINKERRNKSRAYSEAAPTIGNLYNAFINWITGTPWLAGASDYITGNSPVGGKKVQLLSPQQIRTLLPKDRRVYLDAVNRITERDAMRQIIKERANDPRLQEAKDASAEYWNDWQNGAYDEYWDLPNGAKDLYDYEPLEGGGRWYFSY